MVQGNNKLCVEKPSKNVIIRFHTGFTYMVILKLELESFDYIRAKITGYRKAKREAQLLSEFAYLSFQCYSFHLSHAESIPAP